MVVSHKLLLAIFAGILAGKAHLLFAGDSEWFAYSIGLMLQQLIACTVIYSLIGYRDVEAKTLSFMMCLFPLMEIGVFLSGESYLVAALIAAIVSVLWILYAAFRRYTLPSDEITDDFVFAIAKRPNSFITFLASIVGKPFGRYSYYCKGAVYYYHRDYFKKAAAGLYPMDGTTIIKTNIKTTERTKSELERALGTRWSLINNCLTVRLRN